MKQTCIAMSMNQRQSNSDSALRLKTSLSALFFSWGIEHNFLVVASTWPKYDKKYGSRLMATVQLCQQ